MQVRRVSSINPHSPQGTGAGTMLQPPMMSPRRSDKLSPTSRPRTANRPRTSLAAGDGGAGQPGESISTIVRLRPLLTREKQQKEERAKSSSSTASVRFEQPRSVVLIDPQQKVPPRMYEFDVALDSSDSKSPDFADQAAVYRSVGSKIVDHAVDGYNSCLCAYGQTGTGKTHTLYGDWTHAERRGLLPRVAAGLLSRLETLRAGGAEATLQVSFVELYNNRLADLLAPANTSRTPGDSRKRGRLEIRTHPALGVYVDNLSEIEVHSVKDVGRLVSIGDRLRHVAATSMNQQSSRSHTIFTFKLEVRKGSSNTGSRMATVMVADLAGRENEQTSECTGHQFRELTFINRSLFQLANCVHALSDGNRDHVPFRNSKLTLLLSESFQRQSRTHLLATLSPSASAYDENLLTCRFLESTGRITTQPAPNHFCTEELSKRLSQEIERLRMSLGLPSGALQPDLKTLAPELQAMALELKSDQDLLKHLREAHADVDASASSSALTTVKEVLVADACVRVDKALNKAAHGLKRLEEASLAAATSLDKAEGQLSAAEASMHELAQKGPFILDATRPGRWNRAVDLPTSQSLTGTRKVVLPGGEAAQYTKLPALTPRARSTGVDTAGEQAQKAVTFSIALPPIVIL